MLQALLGYYSRYRNTTFKTLPFLTSRRYFETYHQDWLLQHTMFYQRNELGINQNILDPIFVCLFTRSNKNISMLYITIVTENKYSIFTSSIHPRPNQ